MKNFSLKTKGSYRRSSKQSTLQRGLIYTLGALLVVLLLGTVIGKMAMLMVRPFYEVSNYFARSSAALPVYLRDRSALLSEMNDLKEQVSKNEGDTDVIARLTAENETYRNLLSVGNEPRIAAGVIARPPYIPYDMIMLDRGSDDGIEQNAVVYRSSRMAIGYVSTTFSKSSLVTLFSSPGVETTVYIFGPNIFTTAYGQGGGVIRVGVPQGLQIQVGDTVVLPSLQDGILGTVQSVESLATQPEQYGFIVASSSLQSTRVVGVSTRVSTPVTFKEAETHIDALHNELFNMASTSPSGSTTPSAATTSSPKRSPN